MNKFSFVVLLIISFFHSQCFLGQVYFNNKYNEPEWEAIGYKSESKEYSGWVSRGWFKVDPGETKEVLSQNPFNVYIYYYAETEGGKKKFEGNSTFIVDKKDAFFIKNADMNYVLKDNQNYTFYKFRELNKGNSDLWKLKYTIDFIY